MSRIDTSGIWRYVSTFIGNMSDATKDMFEWFWEGIALASYSIQDAAFRFMEAAAPEQSRAAPVVDYYDITIDVTKAARLLLDPTDSGSRTNIIAFSTIKGPISRNYIEISGSDYKLIRDTAIGKYCVISYDGSDPVYYVIENLLGPDVSISDPRYYTTYVIVLKDANLPIIKNQKVVLYITEGRSFQVGNDILDINEIWANITDGVIVEGQKKSRFYKDRDFKFSNGTIEFSEDLVGLGYVTNGDIIYARSVPVIEQNLFELFGNLVGISDWRSYGFDNIMAKVSIDGLVRAQQEPMITESRKLAFNIYYGLPVCPDTARVVGLYESYDYLIDNIDGNIITIHLDNLQTLHPFICRGAKLYCYAKTLEVQVSMNLDSIDRDTGTVKLYSSTGLVTGDVLNVRLNNRIKILEAIKQSLSPTRLGINHWTDGSDLQHIVDILAQKITGIITPRHEIVVYGSTPSGVIDGVYHMTGVEIAAYNDTHMINVRLNDIDNPLDDLPYNDFFNLPITDIRTIVDGNTHIPWPTHKYVLVRFLDGTLYRMYVDSPIDTFVDAGDTLQKYQPLCSCIDVMKNDTFPAWNEYDGFPMNNGIDSQSSIIEVMATIPYTAFGSYFPVA